MILLNTTFVVSSVTERDFLNWIFNELIPEISTHEAFSDHLLTQILSGGEDDEDTRSYAFQFKAPDIEAAEAWLSASGLKKMDALQSRHGGNVLYFTTFMKIIK